nr:iron ABC transporter permease [Bacillota bacterium]
MGRRRAVIPILFLCLLVIVAISLNTGASRMNPVEVVKTLAGMGTAKQELILFEFRLPRVLVAAFAGAGLALSGCVIQAVSRNPLADPHLLGISTGAGVMVVLYLSWFPTGSGAPVLLLPFLAFVGGALAAVLVFALSYERRQGLQPGRLVLTGVAVAAGLSALMTVLSLRLSRELYQFVATWLTGSIWGATLDHAWTLLPWVVGLFLYVYFKSRVLDALLFGETIATGLGVSVAKERLQLLAAAVALGAASVSVSGGIGFVGLIAPHLARRLVGVHHAHVVPASALLGACLLLGADTVGRVVVQPSEIPAGIVVAVVGAPYFLYVLARSAR